MSTETKEKKGWRKASKSGLQASKGAEHDGNRDKVQNGGSLPL